MSDYSIGDISRLTGRTTEAIRRAEKEGRIPLARREYRGERRWNDDDLPEIRAAFGIEDPASNALDSLLATLQDLGPVIARAAEELLQDKKLVQAMEGLLGQRRYTVQRLHIEGRTQRVPQVQVRKRKG